MQFSVIFIVMSSITLVYSFLGCLLHFYCGTMSNKTLCEMFAVPPATLSETMKQAEHSLHEALKHMDEAAIRFPSFAEQIEWSNWVAAKEPLVQRRWGFIDGKNYRVQKPSAADIQNAYYNGWLHSTLVTGTLCFGADGTIVWGRHNFVGSWNDADTSYKFQEKLCDPRKSLDGYGVVADSAFPVSGRMRDRIITPLKDGDLERIPTADRGLHIIGIARILILWLAETVRLNAALICVRQAAEWGMGAVEKAYPRLNLPLPFDATIRQLRLLNIHYLYNFRVRTTGISQILNVYRP
jgi:hypothetical protein